MFNKTKSPAPTRQPVPIPPLPDLPSPSQARQPEVPAAAPVITAAPARGSSTLASDLQFVGNISGSGDLKVDGAIKGDLRVGRLIVGETGAIEGNVIADHVEIQGRVIGAVNGKHVKLLGTAYVDGDIAAEQLSIDVGAYFQGRCIQGRRDVAAAPAPAPVASIAPQPAPMAAMSAPLAAAFPAQPAPAAPADRTQYIDMRTTA